MITRAKPVDFWEKIKSRIPIKRFAEPEKIAKAVVFLLSKESSYVVGHTLAVDGGVLS